LKVWQPQELYGGSRDELRSLRVLTSMRCRPASAESIAWQLRQRGMVMVGWRGHRVLVASADVASAQFALSSFHASLPSLEVRPLSALRRTLLLKLFLYDRRKSYPAGGWLHYDSGPGGA
jgi:hypothetical protein